MSVRPTLPPPAGAQDDVDVAVLVPEPDPFERVESLPDDEEVEGVDEVDEEVDDGSLDEPAPSDAVVDGAAVRDDEPRLSVL
jgi:hypothetical protein